MPARSPNKAVDRFLHERELVAAGFRRIAGVDEAGRGPLAGPVVAAAVILPVAWVLQGVPEEFAGLNDSKQLTARKREEFYEMLIGEPDVCFAIAGCDAVTIDVINILQATHRAMNEALGALAVTPDHALIDGRPVKSLTVAQTALVKGDARSYSIAAASVIAKVTRDRQMDDWDRQHPEYGFRDHKGYGTPAHLAALARLGPCVIHRKTFAPIRPVQRELFAEEPGA